MNFPSISESLEQLYAFSYDPRDEKFTKSTGWVLYDPRLEFSRMEIPPNTWAISDINDGYKVHIYLEFNSVQGSFGGDSHISVL